MEPIIPPASLSDCNEEEIQSTIMNQLDETRNTIETPHQQEHLTDTTYQAIHEDKPAIPDVIVPQEPPGENDLEQIINSHPQRTRWPVEKLNIKWNSKTYT